MASFQVHCNLSNYQSAVIYQQMHQYKHNILLFVKLTSVATDVWLMRSGCKKRQQSLSTQLLNLLLFITTS